MSESTTTAQTIGLLGFGHFGRALSDLVLDAGLRVRAFDPHTQTPEGLRVSSVAELAGSSDLIIPAVPIPSFESALSELRASLTPAHLVIDVASVKRPSIEAMDRLLGREIPWSATHPLFGPASIARGETPLRVVVCPNDVHSGGSDRAQLFYERIGCEVTRQDADEHDRSMADTHALAFFVAKAMLAIGAGQGGAPTPPSFAAMNTTIETVRADAGHLFYPIQSANPFAAESRERLLDALSLIHRELADARQTPPSDPEHAMEIPAPATPPPELVETRDLIDELDRELVDLLARRTKLSHRAARAKAEHGKGVQDPGREAQLLAARKEWGAELGLSDQGLADVFEAILRFSRAEQRQL